MRRQIIDNVPPKELDREIKRGPGGLRDIEFAVQLLQLVHGRVDETLREPAAPCRRCAPWSPAATWAGEDGETLLRGYRFLRGVEHRLQLQQLRRTHTVPDDPAGAALAGGGPGLHGDARPRRRRGVPLRLGRARRRRPPPARQAALPAAAGGGRPGARRGAAADPGVGPASGWRSSASPTRPARCATSRRSPAG